MIARIARLALAGSLVVFAGAAFARPSDCASLPSSTTQERNQRSLCRAVGERKPSYCASITGDTDLKRLCEAQASGEDRHCASIGSSDGRAFCRGVTGAR